MSIQEHASGVVSALGSAARTVFAAESRKELQAGAKTLQAMQIENQQKQAEAATAQKELFTEAKESGLRAERETALGQGIQAHRETTAAANALKLFKRSKAAYEKDPESTLGKRYQEALRKEAGATDAQRAFSAESRLAQDKAMKQAIEEGYWTRYEQIGGTRPYGKVRKKAE